MWVCLAGLGQMMVCCCVQGGDQLIRGRHSMPDGLTWAFEVGRKGSRSRPLQRQRFFWQRFFVLTHEMRASWTAHPPKKQPF